MAEFLLCDNGAFFDMFFPKNSAPLQSAGRGSSPILVTAALSIAVLFAAVGVQLARKTSPGVFIDAQLREPVSQRTYIAIEDADHNGTPDWQDELARSGVVLATSTSTTSLSDPLTTFTESISQSLYGGYLALKSYDAFTPQNLQGLSAEVAEQVRAPHEFNPYAIGDLTIVEDSSKERILEYRADMRVALAPLVNDEPPEIEYFARYIDSKDPQWLTLLKTASERYIEAEKNMLAVAVPQSAVQEHLRALNSLGAYGSALEYMSREYNDALASMALLRTYNDSEQEMLYAFDALAQYYVRTIAQN